MRTIGNIICAFFVLALVSSIGIWFSHELQNIDGDGVNPSQTITATVLGHRRALSCEYQYSYHDWKCDRAFLYNATLHNEPMSETVARVLYPLVEWGLLLLLIACTQLYRIPPQFWKELKKDLQEMVR